MRGNGTVTSYAFDPVSRLASFGQDVGGTAKDVAGNNGDSAPNTHYCPPSPHQIVVLARQMRARSTMCARTGLSET